MMTINGYNIRTVFSFFLKAGIRARRTKLFFLLSLIPTVIFVIVRMVRLLNPEAREVISNYFTEIGGPYYFMLLIPLLALFYGSSVLNDEVDNKTLIYLTTSPVSKSSILVGKFLAHTLIAAIIITAGQLLAYIASSFTRLLGAAYLYKFGLFVVVGLLAVLAYASFFTLLGTLMRKSVILGLLFIFFWETAVQYVPGTTQKLTIIHYVKSLLPVNLANTENPLAVNLQPSSSLDSIVTLLVLTLFFLTLSAILFYKKEFTLSDQS